MTIKERLEIEAKTYSFGDQNEKRTFLYGADFAIKVVIEMLEDRRSRFSKYKSISFDRDSKFSLECKIKDINDIINLLKSEA